MTDRLTFAMLCAVVLVAAVTDVRSGKIYNWLTLPAMAMGIIQAVVLGANESGRSGAWQGFADSGLGLLAGLVPFGIIVLSMGLNAGDAKLMGAVGAITARWESVVETSVQAFVVAALISIFIMVRHRIVKRTFTRIAGAILMTAAKVKPQLPDDSPKVPFAVAIAVGAILSAMHSHLGITIPWL